MRERRQYFTDSHLNAVIAMFCQWVSLSGSVLSNNPNIPVFLMWQIKSFLRTCQNNHVNHARDSIVIFTSPLSLEMERTSLRCSSVSSIPYSSHMTMYSSSDMVPSPPVSALSNNSHKAEESNFDHKYFSLNSDSPLCCLLFRMFLAITETILVVFVARIWYLLIQPNKSMTDQLSLDASISRSMVKVAQSPSQYNLEAFSPLQASDEQKSLLCSRDLQSRMKLNH